MRRTMLRIRVRLLAALPLGLAVMLSITSNLPARQRYNASVLDYNTAIQVFPAVLVAGMFSFTKRDFFDAEPEAEQVPVVQLR